MNYPTGVTSYNVTAKRWGSYWELHIEGVGVTQARTLASAERMVREYLTLDDVPDAATADINIVPALRSLRLLHCLTLLRDLALVKGWAAWVKSRRRLAKALHWTGGQLGVIKTPQRTWRVVSFDPFETELMPRRWLPCKLRTRLIRWSMRLDWEHWEHWGLVHEHCGTHETCPECGAPLCDGSEGDY